MPLDVFDEKSQVFLCHLAGKKLLIDERLFVQDTASECSLDDAEGLSREARSEVSSYLATRKKLTRGNPMTNLRDLDPVVRDFLAMQRLGQLFTNPR